MTDDANEASRRIATLEQEIAELRRKLTRVFTVLDISTIKEPFLRLMISLDATEAQEVAIYDLMGDVDARLSQGHEAMDHFEFCDRAHKIFPGHESQHMAEAIVTRLALDGGWDQVYKHLRKSGMHLRDLREERGFCTVRAASSVVEHVTFNHGVDGSIPSRPTSYVD